MDLERIQKHQRSFTKERDWDQFHTPKNLAMALTGEVGELVEIFQWLTDTQAKNVMADETRASEVRHEMADVFFYLTRLADVLGIDLEKAYWEKMEHNAQKYPVELARGNAKKYSEL